MKLRRASPLLVLLAGAAAGAAVDQQQQQKEAVNNVAAAAITTSPTAGWEPTLRTQTATTDAAAIVGATTAGAAVGPAAAPAAASPASGKFAAGVVEILPVDAKKGAAGAEVGSSEEKRTSRSSGSGAAEADSKKPRDTQPVADSVKENLEKAGVAVAGTAAEAKQAAGAAAEKVADTGAVAAAAAKKVAAAAVAAANDEVPETPYDAAKKAAAAREGPPADSGDRSKWLVTEMPDTEGKTNLNPPKSKLRPGKSSTAAKAAAAAKSGDGAHDGDDHESLHELFHSFVLSFAMIIVSEIGDKTFLVAALMAMRHARLLVFSAALSALIAMTVLSAVLGHAFPTLLPKKLTTLAAAILFFVFGARGLHEGLAMPADAGIGDEMREVEAELEEKEHDLQLRQQSEAAALESGRGRRSPSPPSGGIARHAGFAPKINRPGGIGLGGGANRSRNSRSAHKKSPTSVLAGLGNLVSLVLSPAWVSTFVMTFLGEWGDRSQIATIAMAAGQDYWWVTLGAIGGHACCTGLAVIGGRALAGRVSLRIGKWLSFF